MPRAGPGEILLRVRAAGLNRGELIVGSVMHGGAQKLGGTEAAGEVHAVGPGVTAVSPGDRIMGRVLGHGRGSFAEFAIMDATEAMPVPDGMSWEEAAAIPVTFLVAYDALFPYGRLRRDDWLLVTGVSSGAGVACLQSGKAVGARVIGTSGSEDKLGKLAAIGLDSGIATRAGDFAERVRALTGGRGADVAVNCVGGSMFGACLQSLAFGGRLATVGYVDGIMDARIDLQLQHANRLVLYGVSNSRLDADGRGASVRGFAKDLLPAFSDGRAKPVIDRVYAFDDLPSAKARMESNQQVGKIVVRGVPD